MRLVPLYIIANGGHETSIIVDINNSWMDVCGIAKDHVSGYFSWDCEREDEVYLPDGIHDVHGCENVVFCVIP